jgi:CBS domain-containing protein
MLVRDVMKSSTTCTPSTNLGVVMETLRSCGCDALPVVDALGKVVGMIAGGDICVALGTTNRRPSELLAGQVMSEPVPCRIDDEIHTALGIMKARKTRCLPVLDEEGVLEGILRVSDLILEAQHENGRRPQLSYEDVMGALKGIYYQRSAAASKP